MKMERHATVFLTWLVIYPTITGLSLVLTPVIGGWPIAIQTLLMTVILVPLVSYVLMPFVLRAYSLYKITRRDNRCS